MNVVYDNQERERILKARESFSGRLLTDSQFDEAMAITGVIEREIRETGTFKEKLGDYAHAFARTEKFDALKGEEIIRDLYQARTGQSMNQLREHLRTRETNLFGRKQNTDSGNTEKESIQPQLSQTDKNLAYQYASDIGAIIEKGNKMSFYRAYAHQGSELAKEFEITEVAARRLMNDEFKMTEKHNLYDWGKELEEKYYKPQIQAEKEARDKARSQTEDQKPTRSYQRAR